MSITASRQFCNIIFWLFNTTVITSLFSKPEQWWVMHYWEGWVIGILLLDMMSYWLHRLYHTPSLWRLHALHHSDPDVDWSTSVRRHPIEYLLTSGLYWLALQGLGLPGTVVVIHSTTSFVLEILTHSNMRWPLLFEHLLRPVIITLDLHLTHHSSDPKHANTNFGDILSIWDRLFGTLLVIKRQNLVFGIRGDDPNSACYPIPMLLTPWRIGNMYTNTCSMPDNQEMEVSAERRGGTLRLRSRLIKDGHVMYAHSRDYPNRGHMSDIDKFTAEFEDITGLNLEPLWLFPLEVLFWLFPLEVLLKLVLKPTKAETMPREFERDHKVARAVFNPDEEIWQHRLRLM